MIAILLLAATELPPVQPVLVRPTNDLAIAADWERKPTGAEFGSYYPDRAMRQGVSGAATIACVVRASGALRDCRLVAETPPGYGFGDAAMRLSSLFKMRPQTMDGVPVEGGEVRIPINFGLPSEGQLGDADSSIAFARRPTQQEVDANFPRAPASQGYGARVEVTCDVQPTGALTNCGATAEGPFAKDFAKAAVALAALHRLTPELAQARLQQAPRISFPITLTYYANETSAIRAVQPGAVEGTTRVNCRVNRERGLENCLPAGGRADLLDAAYKVAARISLPPVGLQAGTRLILPVHVVPASQQASPAG